MIIVEIVGGLGSQMFAYAVGLAFAKKTNQELKVDISHLTAWRLKKPWSRNPEILKMNLSGGVATKDDIRKFLFKTSISYVDGFIKRKRWTGKNVYYENRDFDFENMPSIREGYLRGSFGNPKYFVGLKDVLKKEFVLKKKGLAVSNFLRDVKYSESVSIHVRRGDLLVLENAHVVPIEYYKEAVKKIKAKVKNLKFYIFSDGIEWCKNNFDWLENKVFVEGCSIAEDFEIMKNCKHHILANSTLSWWVGYLHEGNGLVICPNHFGTFENSKRKDLMLKKWVILDG